MANLILSTGNVVSGGPTIIRKRGINRSNLELVNSLRENIAAAHQDYAPQLAVTNGNSAVSPAPTPAELWTERVDNALFVPRINWNGAGLREDPDQYEITVKLFLLPELAVQDRERHVRDALELVRKELGIRTIDLLIVAFPGLSFEGSCEWDADKINAQQGNLEDEVTTWRALEDLHKQGLVKSLGVSEFGSEKLSAFIQRTTIHPSVDQINLKDCCKVPPPLKKAAEQYGVELNVHTDCTDILPRGTLREILGDGPQGAGVLAGPGNSGSGIQGEISPKWVVRYLAFVRDRAVIESKGYFAGAELDKQ